MDVHQLLGVAPWAIASAAATWAWQIYVHRDARQERREIKAAEVEEHRDDLTLKLIKAAHDEAQQARNEVEAVRQENKALRAIEEHFYHFEQALNHLEAVLTASDTNERAMAEKNATAFLARMRRLQEAKGNIQQEIQIVESANRIEGKGKK